MLLLSLQLPMMCCSAADGLRATTTGSLTECGLSTTRSPCAALPQVLARALRWHCSVDGSLVCTSGSKKIWHGRQHIACASRVDRRPHRCMLQIQLGFRGRGGTGLPWRRIDGRKCPPWRRYHNSGWINDEIWLSKLKPVIAVFNKSLKPFQPRSPGMARV